ncbi:MAG: nicotinate-nucleotide adenylyltransferase [Rhodocyclaceae bacterium]|nr:nicotinate-nucleotide adenylyltransferase [Rhodocyclaceae bacterium]
MSCADAPLAVLGGTFDPVHHAHLALARAARDRLGIPEVLWIPAGLPPHRGLPKAAAEHRLAMVAAAIAQEKGFRLDETEARRMEPSFTVPTLVRLREQVGRERPLVLLLGADAFLGLPAWHRWRELFTLAHLAVATRPGFSLEGLGPPLCDLLAARAHQEPRFCTPAGGIHVFPLSAGTVSATEVREKIAAGAHDAELLALIPAPVLAYIRAHRLYLADP